MHQRSTVRVDRETPPKRGRSRSAVCDGFVHLVNCHRNSSLAQQEITAGENCWILDLVGPNLNADRLRELVSKFKAQFSANRNVTFVSASRDKLLLDPAAATSINVL